MPVMSATVAAIVLAVADLDALGGWHPEFFAAEVSAGHVTLYGGGHMPLQTVTINHDGTATLLKADGSQWKVSGNRIQDGLTASLNETTFFACGDKFCREFMVAEEDGTGSLQQWGLNGMRVITSPHQIDFTDASGRHAAIRLKLNDGT